MTTMYLDTISTVAPRTVYGIPKLFILSDESRMLMVIISATDNLQLHNYMGKPLRRNPHRYSFNITVDMPPDLRLRKRTIHEKLLHTNK